MSLADRYLAYVASQIPSDEGDCKNDAKTPDLLPKTLGGRRAHLRPQPVRCGRLGCHCMRSGDAGHGPYWYLRWRDGAGRQCKRYVAAGQIEAVRAALKHYHEHERTPGWARRFIREYIARHIGRAYRRPAGKRMTPTTSRRMCPKVSPYKKGESR